MPNEEEHKIIEAMERYGGSFVQALAAACWRADPNNFQRLKKAFPEYWREYSDMAGIPPKEEATCLSAPSDRKEEL